MVITVERDDPRQRLIATATGTLTLDVLVHFVRTQRSGDLRTYALLFDARGASGEELTATEVRTLAWQVGEIAKQVGPRAPVAMVAGSDGLFGMMRMYQMIAESAGVSGLHVVRTLAEAEAALGW